MNNIAISPTIAMYALQNQNVERKIAKNIDLKRAGSNTETNTTNINETTNISDISNTETIDISDISNTETIDINANTEINETSNISNIPSILIPHDQLLNENDNTIASQSQVFSSL